MAKSKLLAALDAHKGRTHKLEQQKKLRKLAEKKKKSKAPQPDPEEKENIEIHANGTSPRLEEESNGWESDGSEAAEVSKVHDAGKFTMLKSFLRVTSR